MSSTTESDLWAFAVQAYHRPGAAEICLTWQDRHQARVNIVLWTLWLEFRGQPLTDTLLDQALAQPWHGQVIQPLRALRRQVKQALLADDALVDAAYEQLKLAELAAEKVELMRLQKLAETAAAGNQSLRPGENLCRYASRLGIPSKAVGELLERLAP